MTPNPFAEFCARYVDDWPGFVREFLTPDLDEWQAAVLTDIQNGESQISVCSGHGVGKSATAAFAVICTMLFRVPFRVVVTAATAGQLFDVLYPEIKLWVKKLPPELQALFDIKSDRIELVDDPANAFLTAKTSRAETPEAMAGVHCDGGWVLLIGDEASGIPEAVFEAAAGSMSGHNVTTLLLGNPVRSTGYFYDTHNKLRDSWKTYRVSCLTSPRVRQAWVEEMALKYGVDSNAYRVRVLGEFPLGDDDTIIPMDLIQSAMGRDIEQAPGTACVWGVDVARFGADSSVIARRRGRVMADPPLFLKGLDIMQVAGRVKAEYDLTPEKERPTEILVDVIGYGAGVVDRLRELGLPARGINVSESPAIGATYANLRAELWFKCREWLMGRDVALPVLGPNLTAAQREAMERLVEELAAVRFKVRDSSGKVQVESKAEMKKRGLKSPDGADALILTFAADATTALRGRDVEADWKRPLRRNLKGIV